MEGQLIDRTFYGLHFNFIDMIFHGQEHFMDMTFHWHDVSWTKHFKDSVFYGKEISSKRHIKHSPFLDRYFMDRAIHRKAIS